MKMLLQQQQEVTSRVVELQPAVVPASVITNKAISGTVLVLV